jgi:hypothetical protein
MNLPRCNFLTLLVALFSGFVGCAGVPTAIPKAPSPADLIKAIPQGNNTTLVNIAPPSPVHQTLPDFLGITRCYQQAGVCLNQALVQTAFCFPGLAGLLPGGPGVLPPFDPNSPAGQSPAVQAAAKIKSEEDAAPQKIAALRYLATIGCAGCYPGVEEAFIAALDDCTESVRYEAVLALRKTSCGGCCKCQGCGSGCCSEKIQKKLREMAYDSDDNGCPKESSERVRRQARLALKQCGPSVVVPETEPTREKATPKTEGPAEGPKAPPAAAQGAAEGDAGNAVLPPPSTPSATEK